MLGHCVEFLLANVPFTKPVATWSYGEGGAFAGWLASSENALDQVSTTQLSVGSAVLFNMLSTAFMCHTNAVRAYDELGPKHRHASVARKAFGLAGLLYGVVMLAGYVTFGGACEGLVLANYDANDPRARVAWIATLVSLLSSYPLLFTGFRDAMCSLLGVATPGKFLPFAGLSLSLLAVPVLLAIVVPDVGFVVSLMGASLGAALILVVPSLIGRRVLADKDCAKGERPTRVRNKDPLKPLPVPGKFLRPIIDPERAPPRPKDGIGI